MKSAQRASGAREGRCDPVSVGGGGREAVVDDAPGRAVVATAEVR